MLETNDRNAVDIAIQSLRGPVRLRTLTTLRWLAVGGQTLAIVLVHFGFGFSTPLGLCLGAIAASAWLNLFVTLRFSPQRFLNDYEATGYIAFDIVQLCALLFLTGGLINPFSALIIAPVTIAASLLPLRLTALIAALAIAVVSLLSLVHLPLPWIESTPINLPGIYKAGVWVALSFSIVFFTAYAHRIAGESAEMKSALAATQLVLSREERLAALGGLAAAAAHELGTPLATIQLTAKEMAHDLKGQGALADDAELLVSQAKRCREILSRLSQRGDEGDQMMNQISVEALLREAAGPLTDTIEGPAVEFAFNPDATGDEDLLLRRQPEILYGLRNFVENAVEFATSKVLLNAMWDSNTLRIHIFDDGPGFSAEALARLGEPYLSSRVRKGGKKQTGLGLGFFISKTLLEKTGATIAFNNARWPDSPSRKGAWVSVAWPLETVSFVEKP